MSINISLRSSARKPPFTLASLRDAIPEKCFTRPLQLSLVHLGKDFLCVALLFAFSQLLLEQIDLLLWLAVLAWSAYWFAQVLSQAIYRLGISSHLISW